MPNSRAVRTFCKTDVFASSVFCRNTALHLGTFRPYFFFQSAPPFCQAAQRGWRLHTHRDPAPITARSNVFFILCHVIYSIVLARFRPDPLFYELRWNLIIFNDVGEKEEASQEADYPLFRQQSLEESLASLYKPPYSRPQS